MPRWSGEGGRSDLVHHAAAVAATAATGRHARHVEPPRAHRVAERSRPERAAVFPPHAARAAVVVVGGGGGRRGVAVAVGSLRDKRRLERDADANIILARRQE